MGGSNRVNAPFSPLYMADGGSMLFAEDTPYWTNGGGGGEVFPGTCCSATRPLWRFEGHGTERNRGGIRGIREPWRNLEPSPAHTAVSH